MGTDWKKSKLAARILCGWLGMMSLLAALLCLLACGPAMLGGSSVKNLFGSPDADCVGQTVRIGSSQYTVVGVVDEGLTYDNDTAYMPAETAVTRLIGQGNYGSWQIIGFDDSPISREAVIPTSTVGQQISVIANEAMEILSAQMEERKKRRPQPMEPVHKVIPPILIRRETTA